MFELAIESILDGREEARNQGRVEGYKEVIETIARNALAEGATLEFVQKITGLDLDTLMKMQESKPEEV